MTKGLKICACCSCANIIFSCFRRCCQNIRCGMLCPCSMVLSLSFAVISVIAIVDFAAYFSKLGSENDYHNELINSVLETEAETYLDSFGDVALQYRDVLLGYSNSMDLVDTGYQDYVAGRFIPILTYLPYTQLELFHADQDGNVLIFEKSSGPVKFQYSLSSEQNISVSGYSYDLGPCYSLSTYSNTTNGLGELDRSSQSTKFSLFSPKNFEWYQDSNVNKSIPSNGNEITIMEYTSPNEDQVEIISTILYQEQNVRTVIGVKVFFDEVNSKMKELSLKKDIVALVSRKTKYVLATNSADKLGLTDNTVTKASNTKHNGFNEVFDHLLSYTNNFEEKESNWKGKASHGYVVSTNEFSNNNLDLVGITLRSHSSVYWIPFALPWIYIVILSLIPISVIFLFCYFGCLLNRVFSTINSGLSKLSDKNLDRKKPRKIRNCCSPQEIWSVQSRIQEIFERMKEYKSFLPEDLDDDEDDDDLFGDFNLWGGGKSPGSSVSAMSDRSDHSSASGGSGSLGGDSSSGGPSTLQSSDSRHGSSNFSPSTTPSDTFRIKDGIFGSSGSGKSSKSKKKSKKKNKKNVSKLDLVKLRRKKHERQRIGLTSKEATIVYIKFRLQELEEDEYNIDDDEATEGTEFEFSRLRHLKERERRIFILKKFIDWVSGRNYLFRFRGKILDFTVDMDVMIGFFSKGEWNRINGCKFAIQVTKEIQSEFVQKVLVDSGMEENIRLEMWMGIESDMMNVGVIGSNKKKKRVYEGPAVDKAIILSNYAKENDLEIIVNESLDEKLRLSNERSEYKFVCMQVDSFIMDHPTKVGDMIDGGVCILDHTIKQAENTEWMYHQPLIVLSRENDAFAELFRKMVDGDLEECLIQIRERNLQGAKGKLLMKMMRRIRQIRKETSQSESSEGDDKREIVDMFKYDKLQKRRNGEKYYSMLMDSYY